MKGNEKLVNPELSREERIKMAARLFLRAQRILHEVGVRFSDWNLDQDEVEVEQYDRLSIVDPSKTEWIKI